MQVPTKSRAPANGHCQLRFLVMGGTEVVLELLEDVVSTYSDRGSTRSGRT